MFLRKLPALIGVFLCCLSPLSALTISDEEALETGRRIWQNECSGRVDGLTSWNQGEAFASLGIGHFIWYPEGPRGPFEESFPKMVAYLKTKGADVPDWLLEAKTCPWPNREAFLADFQGSKLTGLRKLLASTVALQARFAANRLEATLPRMLESLPDEKVRNRVHDRFEKIASSNGGTYALMDYVNFKGEGVNSKERYAGKGWGLLQVLEEMHDGGNPLRAFASAADNVLTERVKNSPPARNEGRWLVGWRKRLRTY